MQINKNIAELTNFIFEIDNIVSIELIILNILLRSIIFYIMLIYTLFLLCLANMNKLRVFFNNITKQVIQL